MAGEQRAAFYALRPGGWRDYVTLLHVPYTAWHLAYVTFGAVAAPVVDGSRLGWSVLGFFLGVGLAAHALDELAGHPLGTRIPRQFLWTLAGVSLAAAVALGIAGALRVSWWMLAFVAFGSFIVLAYNLEGLSRFNGVLRADRHGPVARPPGGPGVSRADRGPAAPLHPCASAAPNGRGGRGPDVPDRWN